VRFNASWRRGASLRHREKPWPTTIALTWKTSWAANRHRRDPPPSIKLY
jgi:hypothetical protein